MSLLKAMSEAEAEAATSGSLSDTTWSLSYSKSPSTIVFSAGGTGTFTYPNGQQVPIYWCESGGSFWVNNTAFQGWLELIVGTHSNGKGSGSMVEANMRGSRATLYPYTMVKRA
jgi:hypothetical protein